MSDPLSEVDIKWLETILPNLTNDELRIKSVNLLEAYRQQAKQIAAMSKVVGAAEAWAKWVPHRDGMTDFLKLEEELAIAVKSYQQAIKAFREE